MRQEEQQRPFNTYVTFRLTVPEAERLRRVSEETDIPMSRLVRRHLAPLLREPAKQDEPPVPARSP